MHVLQTTLLSAPGQPDGAFLRLKRGRTSKALPKPRLDGALGLALEAGDDLSSDTLIGAFPCGHWRTLTGLARLGVAVTFRGTLRLRVMEETGGAVVQLCQTELTAEELRREVVWLAPAGLEAGLGDPTADSRIYLELRARGESEVMAIDHVTDMHPAREVRLALGVLAQPEGAGRLAGLLPVLQEMAARTPEIAGIYVAGAEGPVPPAAGLHVLRQGGKMAPSGFAAILDRLQHDEEGQRASHVLLLTDDIVLARGMLERVLPLLRYAQAPMMLGATLLDRANPMAVLGAGAVLDSQGKFRFVAANDDLSAGLRRDEDGRQPFHRAESVDYLPWNLCVLPLDKATATPMPRRPWHRGDDLAYMRDQIAQGIAAFCLPSLVTWREHLLHLPPQAGAEDEGYDLSARYLPVLHGTQGEMALADTARGARGAQRLHLLQRTLFPVNGLPEAIYLQATPPRKPGGLLPRWTAAGQPVVQMDPKDVLSTDSFFGSFYRAYWCAHTGVADLAVAVELQGRAEVRIYEDAGLEGGRRARNSLAGEAAEKGHVLLAREVISSKGQARFLIDVEPCVPRPAAGEANVGASRIYVEIHAETPCTLFNIDYLTAQAPRRRATLSIGLVTFNQEAYFARTLDLVARLAAAHDSIGTVHVVNQGEPFRSEAIKALLHKPKLRLIEQRNLGGCGGFTRTLVEEMSAAEPASHHLMMDDDIVLDERVILRALRFLDYAERDISVGAAMLDSMRPNVIYEAGAFLLPQNAIAPYANNVDITDPKELAHFNKPVQTDYNAWWFCILPVERARSLALPAPVFIRGDDFEYGQRLARNGVVTVTLPGIGVWHEPFYAKPASWQNYYDLRNRLIFGATYGETVRQSSLAHVVGMITAAVLTHNYMAAELRMRAVLDFLLGPEVLFSRDSQTIHQEIMDLAKAHAPERLEGPRWRHRPLAPAKPKHNSMRRLALDQFRSLLRTGFGPLRRQTDTILLDVDAHPANTGGRGYILSNGPRSFHIRFVPDRWRMWTMLVQAAWIGWRYMRERHSIGREWNARIVAYRQPEWWARTFGAKGSPQSDAPHRITKPKTANAWRAAETGSEDLIP